MDELLKEYLQTVMEPFRYRYQKYICGRNLFLEEYQEESLVKSLEKSMEEFLKEFRRNFWWNPRNNPKGNPYKKSFEGISDIFTESL